VADDELEVTALVDEAVADAVLLLVPLYANMIEQAPSYRIGIAKFVPITLL
jgi:hypothetical protein